jgi:hypothetical protein
MVDTKGGCCLLKGDLLKFPPYYIVQVFSKNVVCRMAVPLSYNDLYGLPPSSTIAYRTSLAAKRLCRGSAGATLVSLDLVSACCASVRVPHRVSIRKGSG